MGNMLGYCSVSGVQSHDKIVVPMVVGPQAVITQHPQLIKHSLTLEMCRNSSLRVTPGLPQASSCSLSSIYFWEDDQPWELPPPVLPPPSHCVAPPLIFCSYVLFSLPSIGPFKMGDRKICEIKIEKSTIPCRV